MLTPRRCCLAPSTAPYRIVLSDDTQLDASDTELGAGQVTLTGAVNTIDQMVTIPANIQVRQWRILLVVDPNGAIVESDDTNNIVASGTPVQVAQQVAFTNSPTGSPAARPQ